jgi:hypothetical protein
MMRGYDGFDAPEWNISVLTEIFHSGEKEFDEGN